MATNSMQRTLALLRNDGVKYEITEHYNHFSRKRNDLFGIFDILAIDDGKIVGIQACGTDWQPHVKKIKESEYALPFIQAGGEIRLYGWRKILRKKGGILKVWTPRIKVFTEEDFKDETNRIYW